jgi:GAF domain-containing protein
MRDEVAELRAALAREERIASALREVGNALGTTLDLDDLLELILGRLTDLLEADRCTLYLLDQAKAELVSRIVIGEQVRSIRVRVGHGIAGTVAKTGKAIRLKDAYTDSRFEPEWDLFTGYRTKSMLAAPLKNHMGRTIGVIQVLNKTTGEEFTAEDEAILSALSTQAAVAIDKGEARTARHRPAAVERTGAFDGARRIPGRLGACCALGSVQGVPGAGGHAAAR